MSELWIPAIILFGTLGIFLILGLPMAFTLGGAAVITALILEGPRVLSFVQTNVFGVMTNLVLIATPLFVFMAVMLEKSGIAEDLYYAMHQWMGPIRGGLAIGTVTICTIIAAMSGISTTGTVTMGLIALPVMLRKGYDKTISIGPIMAGGALGILIPPSVAFILFGMFTKTSVGKLFAGGLIPGLMLSLMYMLYIGITCYFKPHLGPVLPKEERVSFKQKVVLSRSLILPILLIVAVLGSIFGGIASPTESAAVGAFGALICAAVNRRLNWKMLTQGLYTTANVTGMLMWILFAAFCFSSIFISTHGGELVKSTITGLNVPPFVVILVMMITYFILGCFMDDVTIMILTVPIYMPILVAFGYDPVWFGVLFIVNMQMAYLTPPFGYTLFYLKGVAPPGVTITDIYRSTIPFVGMQLIAVLLVLFFPQLALWLPNVVFGLK